MYNFYNTKEELNLKICAFYNTKNKCRNGNECPFIHSEYKNTRPSKKKRQQLKSIKADFVDKKASGELIFSLMKCCPYTAAICNDILPNGIHYIGSV